METVTERSSDFCPICQKHKLSKPFISIAHLIFTTLWDVNILLFLFYRRGNRLPGDTTWQWLSWDSNAGSSGEHAGWWRARDKDKNRGAAGWEKGCCFWVWGH